MRTNPPDPARLTEVGATELERRLLAAVGRERPSLELTRRMRAALPIAAVTAAAATAHAGTASASAAAPALAKAAGAKVIATWTTVALLSVGGLGGVVGVSLFSRARTERSRVVAGTIASEPHAPAAMPGAPATSEGPRERLVKIPASTPAPTRHRQLAQAGAGALGEEIALIDAARTAVREGAPARALTLLRRYRQSFPKGTFSPEASVLEVEALSANGEHDRAQTLARQFLAQHRESPLAPRVARFADDGGR